MSIEFSESSYRSLLKRIQANDYEFIGYGDIQNRQASLSRACVLRHDIDVSMDYAYEMAKLEFESGIRSTYFVMLRSPLYNLFSRHSTTLLRRLVELGHDIGLHFDAGFSLPEDKSLEEWICFEANLLEVLAGVPVKAFSFHQPSEEIIMRKVEVEGLLNTYHSSHTGDFKYISDSNRVWREYDPIELIKAGFDRIHLLLHPIWWISDLPTTEICWNNAIALNFENSQRQLLDTERAYGKRRIMTLD